MTEHNVGWISIALSGVVILIAIVAFGAHPVGLLPIVTAACMLAWPARKIGHCHAVEPDEGARR